MNQGQWLKMICLGTLLGVGSAADGWGDETNPYLSIVERNPFDLKDPPPPPEPLPPPEQPKPPPPKVKLTGITSLFNKKKALVEVTDPTGGKKVTPLIMVEGDSKEGVELISINMEKNEVVMKVDGEVSTITFETQDIAAAAAGGPQGAPGKGPRPGSKVTPTSNPRVPNPTASTAPYPAAGGSATGAGPVVISSRGSGSQNGGVTVAGAASYGPSGGAPNQAPVSSPSYNASATAAARAANPTYNSNTRIVPTRDLRTDGQPIGSTPQISKEEIMRRLHAAQIKAEIVNPSLSPQVRQALQEVINE